MVLAKSRHVGHCNRKGNPEMNSHSYSYQILTKESVIYIGQKISSSTNGVGETGHPHAEG
jgi:hypothetical protein